MSRAGDLRGAAAIVGVAESPLGEVRDLTVLGMQAVAAKEALGESGLRLAEVDAVFSAGAGLMASVEVAEYLGIRPRYTDSTQIGGSSFEAHVGHALMAIAHGLCDVALVTYASRQRSQRSRTLAGRGGGGFDQTLQGQFEAPFGLPLPVGAYALAATRHMALYGTTAEHMAQVAVSTREWAMLNEKAWRRDPLTIADVMASPMISTPLHLLDCCLVVDGGGALVLTSAERAVDLARSPVYVLGRGESHDHMAISQMPELTETAAVVSGPDAFAMAGLGPGDIDVCQLYDSFTITVLLALEDLGFCPKGESGPFVEDGRLGPGGNFPTNTSGGGLSYCHPGMLGLLLLVEAVRQLRGECGPRQVEGAEVACVHGVGGVLSSTATVILGTGATL